LALGATLAGASGDILDALNAYGAAVGEAFQIRDDLAGLSTGDLEQAKPTMLLASARRLAAPSDRTFHDERLGRGALSEGDRSRALEILRSCGAVEGAEELANALIDRALAALDPAVLGPEPAGAL